MSEPRTWQPVHRRTISGLASVIAVIAAVWFLRAASVFAMPLAAAFFLAILVRPIQVWLDRHLPAKVNWMSLPVTALVILGVLAIGLGLLWICVMLVIEAAPRYSDEFAKLVRDIQQWAESHDVDVDQSFGDMQQVSERLVNVTTMIISSASYIIAMLTLIFFLAILLLVEWDEIQRRARTTISHDSSQGAMDMLNAVASKIRKYLVVRTAVSALTGLTAWGTLYLLDIDLAPLWAVLIFMLNYIPNIGSVISIIPPVLFAALQHDAWWAMLTWAALGAIQLFIGNYIDPRLEGRTLKVSSLLVLVSIIFWGWVWGIPGMILGVPMTITMITIFSHIRPLKPVAILLSSADGDEDEEKNKAKMRKKQLRRERAAKKEKTTGDQADDQ